MRTAAFHGSEQLHVRKATSSACYGANCSSSEAAAVTAFATVNAQGTASESATTIATTRAVNRCQSACDKTKRQTRCSKSARRTTIPAVCVLLLHGSCIKLKHTYVNTEKCLID